MRSRPGRLFIHYYVTASPNAYWMDSPGYYGPNYLTDSNRSPGLKPYVYLTINNNTNITGNLNANLALSDPACAGFNLGGEYIPLGAALGWQETAPMTIIDDNIRPGILGFSSPTYSVNENAGTATITVVRTNGTDGDVQISYTTVATGSSATNRRGLLQRERDPGLSARASPARPSPFPLINGTTIQPDKTLNLASLRSDRRRDSGPDQRGADHRQRQFCRRPLEFTSATYGTNENLGPALITVQRLGGASGTLTVDIATTDGTAVNGVNYFGSTNMLHMEQRRRLHQDHCGSGHPRRQDHHQSDGEFEFVRRHGQHCDQRQRLGLLTNAMLYHQQRGFSGHGGIQFAGLFGEEIRRASRSSRWCARGGSAGNHHGHEFHRRCDGDGAATA